jgi:hypothetical protein
MEIAVENGAAIGEMGRHEFGQVMMKQNLLPPRATLESGPEIFSRNTLVHTEIPFSRPVLFKVFQSN